MPFAINSYHPPPTLVELKLLPSTSHSSGTGIQGFIVNLGGDFNDMFFLLTLTHGIEFFDCSGNHPLVTFALFWSFDILKCIWCWLPKQWQLSVVGFCPFVASREWAINIAPVSDDVDFFTFLPTGVGDTGSWANQQTEWIIVISCIVTAKYIGSVREVCRNRKIQVGCQIMKTLTCVFSHRQTPSVSWNLPQMVGDSIAL